MPINNKYLKGKLAQFENVVRKCLITLNLIWFHVYNVNLTIKQILFFKTEKCRVPETPAGLTITTDVTDDQMKKGQHLTFACENRNHIIKGNATLECLENGQWSNPLPTCEGTTLVLL